MTDIVRAALIGAGRIGAVHAGNVAANRHAELVYVVDVVGAAAEKLATAHGATVAETERVLNDDSLDAVIIASSTDTHADLIERCARAGKAIFCEKPIDLAIDRADECLVVVAKSKVPLALGFNRRFDKNFMALRAAIESGKVGEVETIAITSRDPSPPPAEYIEGSGGLFRDMMIHDFDMARWLLGEEPTEVFAMASCLVDPKIGEMGDVDTAVVTLRTTSGQLCSITNSRRAVYGYDQRIEVFGSGGMMRAENELSTTVEFFGENGVCRDTLLSFFLDRYAQAYRREMSAFIDEIRTGRSLSVGGTDGLRALLLADAAQRSYQLGRAIPVETRHGS